MMAPTWFTLHQERLLRKFHLLVIHPHQLIKGTIDCSLARAVRSMVKVPDEHRLWDFLTRPLKNRLRFILVVQGPKVEYSSVGGGGQDWVPWVPGGLLDRRIL
jgi:hypothetical protein